MMSEQTAAPAQPFLTTRRALGVALTTAATIPTLASPLPLRAGGDPARGDAPARVLGEPIVDPDIPIVDSLHHLFVRPNVRYLVDDYLADASAGHKVVASIYMQAGAFLKPDGPPVLRGLGEVEFANGVGAMCESGTLGKIRVCAGIVGHVDLREDGVSRFLDEASARAPDRFRGVRQGANHDEDPAVMKVMPEQPPAGLLSDPRFRRGFALLEPRGLTFDAAVFHPQLGDVAALADAFPRTTIVLNHAGLALGVGRYAQDRAGVFADWRRGLRAVAARPNVRCRISGLGLPFWGFAFDKAGGSTGSETLAAAWQPYVQEAIDAFGADRCMMASNFPPDRSSATFVSLWNALKRSVGGASAAEKAAMFSGNAAATYRIGPI